jgi:uncharacterized protein (TIGR03435 family)
MAHRTALNLRSSTHLLLALVLGSLAFPFTFLPQSIYAQQPANIVGDWQGTLEFSQKAKFRLVLRVARADNGTLTALNYSIDQGPEPMHTTSVTLQGNTFRFTIPTLHGAYEGQLSADGNALIGTWSQTAPIPLNFIRSTKATAWDIPVPPPPLKPMAADADPSFEVATIKPVDPNNTTPKFFRIIGRRYIAHDTSLTDLIEVAYSVHPRQITGGPAWISTDKFDLVGVPDAEGEPNVRQWITMLQKFLADRFALTFHRDKKELSVYILSLEADGPRNLARSESTSPFPSLEFHPGSGGLTLPAKNTTLSQFAAMMQMVVLDRPVEDQTGLSGKFDFQLTFTPDESQFSGHPPQLPSTATTNSSPGLFEAMHAQLGLKLSATKARVDVLVIDSVQKPPEN